MADVVLVTGVSRYLGGRFARLLTAAPGVGRVIGIDVIPPPHDIGSAEFVRADIRNPMIARIINQADVDTVVHMNVIVTPLSAGGRVSQKEINVIGTMQLLAACQKAPSIRRLVVKSSAAVYGSSPRDPAMFAEDMGPKALPRAGFGKDSVEVEGYVRGFARRRPDADVTVLRFANFLGAEMETPMSAYFELPVVPTVLGFDPRVQFVHQDDGLDCLRLCTVEGHPGTFNVAGDGVLALSQAIRKTGRPRLPLPSALVSSVGGVVRRANVVDFSPEQLRFLTYGRGVDTTRMRAVLGFEPRYTTAACFDDFVCTRRLNTRFPPEAVARVEQRLLAALTAGSAGRPGDTDG